MQRKKKQNESHDESINLLEYDDPVKQFNEEEEQEQRELNKNLTDIFMDLGPISRENAPQKLQKSSRRGPPKAKILLKVPVPKPKSSTPLEDEPYDNLFNNHLFHHLLGLSSIKKTLLPTIPHLLFPRDFEFEDNEDSFTNEKSYDHSQIIQSSKKASRKERVNRNAPTLSQTAGTATTKTMQTLS